MLISSPVLHNGECSQFLELQAGVLECWTMISEEGGGRKDRECSKGQQGVAWVSSGDSLYEWEFLSQCETLNMSFKMDKT